MLDISTDHVRPKPGRKRNWVSKCTNVFQADRSASCTASAPSADEPGMSAAIKSAAQRLDPTRSPNTSPSLRAAAATRRCGSDSEWLSRIVSTSLGAIPALVGSRFLGLAWSTGGGTLAPPPARPAAPAASTPGCRPQAASLPASDAQPGPRACPADGSKAGSAAAAGPNP